MREQDLANREIQKVQERDAAERAKLIPIVAPPPLTVEERLAIVEQELVVLKRRMLLS